MLMTNIKRSTAIGVACLLWALTLSAPTALAVEPAGGGEPATTNTTTNTYFFNWNNGGSSDYSVCFLLYRDGLVQNEYLSDCHKQTGLSGIISRQYTDLQEGHIYGVSAFSWEYVDGVGYAALGINKSSVTTIDLTGPSIGVTIDGPATFTNDPVLALHIDYNDALSVPFPGPVGGATYGCLTLGAPCGAAQAAYQEGCSRPQPKSNRVTTFDCTQKWNGADGKLYYCADEADAATPDNPAGPDQTSTSDKANHSGFVCGFVTLDRVAPVVTATANGGSSVAVLRRTSVKLRATALDAAAGPDGQYEWNFGDNTRRGSGAATTHTFTQTGTYVARATTHDKAKTIHAAAPPYYATGSGNAGSDTVRVRVVTSAYAVTQNATAGALAIQAPRLYRLKARAKVPVTLATTSAGRAGLTLVCRSRTIARGSRRFTKPGSARIGLRLPSTAKPGACALKVSFKANGSAKTSVKSIRITLRAR